MKLTLNGYDLDLSVRAHRHGHWVALPVEPVPGGYVGRYDGLEATLSLTPAGDDRIDFRLACTSPWLTRLRLRVAVPGMAEPFHLIPGNIHGDNNAAHVRPGEFPVLAIVDQPHAAPRNVAPLWEFRADRASHPVSILSGQQGAVGLFVQPYSDCPDADEGFIRNGVFAELPDAFGVSLGYGNDPLTFHNRTDFTPATADRIRTAETTGTLYVFRGGGRLDAHRIVRAAYDRLREIPDREKSPAEALHALATAFIEVNWSRDVGQYTNRKCVVGPDRKPATPFDPWRAIVEIGWTGGSMMAYPFELAARRFPDLTFPKTGAALLDEICDGFNERSGLINDTAINRSTKRRPEGWNASDINGWWSGYISPTRDNHCAYTNGHAAYYLLRTALVTKAHQPRWIGTAKKVLDTAVELQRADGAFGYIFASTEQRVIDYDGFAGCWFAAALPLLFKRTGDARYLDAAKKAARFYRGFVRGLSAWGAPMDTCRSVDSEGNLAFIRVARLLHEITGNDEHLAMLRDGAHYEYLWRYGFRTRPQAPPLKGSDWNSCGGSITSVSNPHMHPMSVIATDDLRYLARVTGDDYHARRADDGVAWMLNTMELYPHVTGYGRYGVLSERTCPSDALLSERYSDGTPASTWWSYNAWAAACAMEAFAEELLFNPAAAEGSRASGNGKVS
jgi:hypothetical protein